MTSSAILLRAQMPDDATFMTALFDANARAILAPAGLPETMIAALVAMQHRSQGAAYAAAYPDARSFVIERDAEPVGRLLEADVEDAVHIVDIALTPPNQGQGLGSALVRLRLAAAAARGLGMQAQAALDNTRSLRLFRRLGFAETEGVGAHIRFYRCTSPKP